MIHTTSSAGRGRVSIWRRLHTTRVFCCTTTPTALRDGVVVGIRNFHLHWYLHQHHRPLRHARGLRPLDIPREARTEFELLGYRDPVCACGVVVRAAHFRRASDRELQVATSVLFTTHRTRLWEPIQ